MDDDKEIDFSLPNEFSQRTGIYILTNGSEPMLDNGNFVYYRDSTEGRLLVRFDGINLFPGEESVPIGYFTYIFPKEEEFRSFRLGKRIVKDATYKDLSVAVRGPDKTAMFLDGIEAVLGSDEKGPLMSVSA